MRSAPTEQPMLLEEQRQGKVRVYINPDYEGAVDHADMFGLPAILDGLTGAESRLAGRATLWAWHPDWHEGPGFVVRQYAHGGLLGRLTGTLFPAPGRMLDEFRVAIRACRRGVPTAMPVALRTERVCGPLLRAHYVSESIADAVNLLQLLEQLDTGVPFAGPQRRRLAAGVANAIARMHDAGVLHGDLNLKNV
ncbi:MAG: lipopolysaccharide kinase InaA family protein, partial [Planctomycetota bacterium]